MKNNLQTKNTVKLNTQPKIPYTQSERDGLLHINTIHATSLIKRNSTEKLFKKTKQNKNAIRAQK